MRTHDTEYGVWTCIRDWDAEEQLACGAQKGAHTLFVCAYAVCVRVGPVDFFCSFFMVVVTERVCCTVEVGVQY